jgi:deoxyribodipyrimidine photo-lyase
MTYLDQKFNDFEVGVNYQNLSLNGRTRKFASDFMENEEKNPLVKKRGRILRLHTMADIDSE